MEKNQRKMSQGIEYIDSHFMNKIELKDKNRKGNFRLSLINMLEINRKVKSTGKYLSLTTDYHSKNKKDNSKNRSLQALFNEDIIEVRKRYNSSNKSPKFFSFNFKQFCFQSFELYKDLYLGNKALITKSKKKEDDCQETLSLLRDTNLKFSSNKESIKVINNGNGTSEKNENSLLSEDFDYINEINKIIDENRMNIFDDKNEDENRIDFAYDFQKDSLSKRPSFNNQTSNAVKQEKLISNVSNELNVKNNKFSEESLHLYERCKTSPKKYCFTRNNYKSLETNEYTNLIVNKESNNKLSINDDFDKIFYPKTCENEPGILSKELLEMNYKKKREQNAFELEKRNINDKKNFMSEFNKNEATQSNKKPLLSALKSFRSNKEHAKNNSPKKSNPNTHKSSNIVSSNYQNQYEYKIDCNAQPFSNSNMNVFSQPNMEKNYGNMAMNNNQYINLMDTQQINNEVMAYHQNQINQHGLHLNNNNNLKISNKMSEKQKKSSKSILEQINEEPNSNIEEIFKKTPNNLTFNNLQSYYSFGNNYPNTGSGDGLNQNFINNFGNPNLNQNSMNFHRNNCSSPNKSYTYNNQQKQINNMNFFNSFKDNYQRNNNTFNLNMNTNLNDSSYNFTGFNNANNLMNHNLNFYHPMIPQNFNSNIHLQGNLVSQNNAVNDINNTMNHKLSSNNSNNFSTNLPSNNKSFQNMSNEYQSYNSSNSKINPHPFSQMQSFQSLPGFQSYSNFYNQSQMINNNQIFYGQNPYFMNQPENTEQFPNNKSFSTGNVNISNMPRENIVKKNSKENDIYTKSYIDNSSSCESENEHNAKKQKKFTSNSNINTKENDELDTLIEQMENLLLQKGQNKQNLDKENISQKSIITEVEYKNFLQGNLLKILQDKSRSKFMQKMTTKISDITKNLILDEILKDLIYYIQNEFCNYFLQKFFKTLTNDQALQTLKLLSSIPDYLDSTHENKKVKYSNSIPLLSMKPEGVYLIHSILSRNNTSKFEVDYIFLSIKDHLRQILVDKLGYKILLKLITKLDENQIELLLSIIFSKFTYFVKNQQSNEVIKTMISKRIISNDSCNKLGTLINSNFQSLAFDEEASSLIVTTIAVSFI